MIRWSILFTCTDTQIKIAISYCYMPIILTKTKLNITKALSKRNSCNADETVNCYGHFWEVFSLKFLHMTTKLPTLSVPGNL